MRYSQNSWVVCGQDQLLFILKRDGGHSFTSFQMVPFSRIFSSSVKNKCLWEAGFWSPSIYACDYVKSRGRREVSLQMGLRSLISWPLTREVILDFLGGQESQRDAWGEEAGEIRGFTEIWLTAAGPEDGEVALGQGAWVRSGGRGRPSADSQQGHGDPKEPTHKQRTSASSLDELGSGFIPRAPRKEPNLTDTLIFSWWDPYQTSDPQNRKIKYLCCFKFVAICHKGNRKPVQGSW